MLICFGYCHEFQEKLIVVSKINILFSVYFNHCIIELFK